MTKSKNENLELFLSLVQFLKENNNHWTNISVHLRQHYNIDNYTLSKHFADLLIKNDLADEGESNVNVAVTQKGLDTKYSDYRRLYKNGKLEKPNYLRLEWYIEKLAETWWTHLTALLLGFLLGLATCNKTKKTEQAAYLQAYITKDTIIQLASRTQH